MAMACLRLFTVPALPRLPERSVPRFLRRMALATVLLAPLLYRRPRDFLPVLLLRAIYSSPLKPGFLGAQAPRNDKNGNGVIELAPPQR
jgi:hypothetical protein